MNEKILPCVFKQLDFSLTKISNKLASSPLGWRFTDTYFTGFVFPIHTIANPGRRPDPNSNNTGCVGVPYYLHATVAAALGLFVDVNYVQWLGVHVYENKQTGDAVKLEQLKAAARNLAPSRLTSLCDLYALNNHWMHGPKKPRRENLHVYRV